MEMTEDEIRKSYNQAKNKNMQIGILADLNACSRQEIKEILGLVKRKPKLPIKEILESLYDELDYLDADIKRLEEKYKKVSTTIELFENMEAET